ncbi:diflavin flavoprotein [Spirulina major CS-329]|uniref:diflavin flavoprotein n=1 Tax=Spirulina TaxID=1154 RepID=UPI00232EEF6F|nr:MULTISPECIES: diflavin flavoprotein [Spirulina]MDB9496630.1 diflavin flavoprotein [Spirulina subsalsa CS-330]MDB9503805.1 diflavin flavoprotein [Spirulina major CS-329]
MVATAEQAQKRLTIQTAEVAADTTVIRSLDWDRDRFDIEFGLQNGTTYNGYIIRGDQLAIVDTSHAKFKQLYLDALTGQIDPSQIEYLVISHTEPDHSGLVKDVLALAPNATVVGSKVAIQFLEGFIHQDFQRQIVKSGDKIDLGKGHVLEFVNAPNLHWPDTILTYDWGTQTLFTCDVFGLHYCSDDLFDVQLSAIEPDYRFYYDCLMGPNARSVLGAIKRMKNLGEVTTVANGHGPLLRHNAHELIQRYHDWSVSQTKGETVVAVFYVSDYGYSDRLSQAIAHGITKTGIAVEMMDMIGEDQQEIRELAERAAGLVIAMPPAAGDKAAEASTSLSTILASANDKQVVGLLESYGSDDEPLDPLLTKFRNLGVTVAFPSIRIKDNPDEALYQLCDEAGTDLGQFLSREKSIKKRKSLDSDLDKAIGRISGGLYIITAQKSDVKGAMLASWVSQASFEPFGVSIAVAKDRAIESLMQVGDRFVLNVLEDGNYQPLMKHFLKRFKPGQDRFEGIETRQANNGAPILADALAYLECEVVSRMDVPDHWIVYSQVTDGRVAKTDSRTAVHHRKVGNYY